MPTTNGKPKMKRCSGRCRKLLPADTTHFYANAASADDLANVCIECNTEYGFERNCQKTLREGGPAALRKKLEDTKRRVRIIQRVLKEVPDGPSA